MRFYRHPGRAFVQRCLGVYLGDDVEAIPLREPMELQGLSGWHVGETLLRRSERDAAQREPYRVMRAEGLLPLGTPGQIAFERRQEEVRCLLEAFPLGPALADVSLDIALDEVRLVGQIRDRFQAREPGAPNLRVERSFSAPAPKHRLAAWIRHLALQCQLGEPVTTLLIGRKPGKAVMECFDPVSEPLALLQSLVRLYGLGQRWPLPLFPDASWTYVTHRDPGGAITAAVQELQKRSPGGRPGDAHDPYVRQLYPDPWLDHPDAIRWPQAPEEMGFEAVARSVLQPLCDHHRAGEP